MICVKGKQPEVAFQKYNIFLEKCFVPKMDFRKWKICYFPQENSIFFHFRNSIFGLCSYIYEHISKNISYFWKCNLRLLPLYTYHHISFLILKSCPSNFYLYIFLKHSHTCIENFRRKFSFSEVNVVNGLFYIFGTKYIDIYLGKIFFQKWISKNGIWFWGMKTKNVFQKYNIFLEK